MLKKINKNLLETEYLSAIQLFHLFFSIFLKILLENESFDKKDLSYDHVSFSSVDYCRIIDFSIIENEINMIFYI